MQTKTSFAEFHLLNHVVHSSIIQPSMHIFTVTDFGASVETIQSCTELGAKTRAGGK